MIYTPLHHQIAAANHLETHPKSGLFMDMGLGKTVVALTCIEKELYETMSCKKCLVIAPRRVANKTWPDEIKKWNHLSHLKYSQVSNSSEKKRIEALNVKADVYIINIDNLQWLWEYLKNKWDFDMVIVDESSTIKNPGSKRFRSLRKALGYIKRIHILTGTPGQLIDIWSQIYVLDRGQRLYEKVGHYRARYFMEIQITEQSCRYEPWDKQPIYDKISDICISMKKEDYIKLPALTIIDREIEMSEGIKKMYKQFKKDQILPIMDKLTSEDNSIRAFSAGALHSKLMQFNGGAVYDEESVVHEFHEEKLDDLEELIEESQDEPVLVLYWYKHELERLLKRFPHARVCHTDDDVDDWNQKKIKLMFGQPQSIGIGLNMQFGGRIMVFFSMLFSEYYYQQTIARFHRQGQEQPVFVYRMIMKGTRDENAVNVLDLKMEREAELMLALKLDLQEVGFE